MTSTETIFGDALSASLGAGDAFGAALDAAIGVRAKPVSAKSERIAKYRCNGPDAPPGVKGHVKKSSSIYHEVLCRPQLGGAHQRVRATRDACSAPPPPVSLRMPEA